MIIVIGYLGYNYCNWLWLLYLGYDYCNWYGIVLVDEWSFCSLCEAEDLNQAKSYDQ